MCRFGRCVEVEPLPHGKENEMPLVAELGDKSMTRTDIHCNLRERRG